MTWDNSNDKMAARMANKRKPLSKQQKDFALHYVLTLNATMATRRAHYKGKTENALAVQGSRLLANAKVRDEIQRVFAELTMPAEEVTGRLSTIARGVDFTRFIEHVEWTDDKGNKHIQLQFDLKKLQKAGLGNMIKTVRQTQHGTEVVFHDPMRALEDMAKVHKLFVEQIEVDHGDIEWVVGIPLQLRMEPKQNSKMLT